MSDILQPIIAPNLTEVKYGYNVKQQFENIDSNFRKLGNRDFVKGEKGADLGLEQISLFDTTSSTIKLTELGAVIFNALLGRDDIQKGYKLSDYRYSNDNDSDNNSPLKPILNTSWYDYFLDKDGKPDPETSKVSIFYREVNQLLKDSTKEYIGSPIPLVFIDARFTSDVISETKSTYNNYDLYKDIVDKSCALYISYGKDEKGNKGWIVEKVNQFPTLYYEDSMFKWCLSSKRSGIRAQGIQGLDGKSGRVWIGLTDCLLDKGDEQIDLFKINSAYVPIQYVMSFYNLTGEDESIWITPEAATEVKHGGLSVGDTIIMIPKKDITNRLKNLDSIGTNMMKDIKDLADEEAAAATSANNQIWISVVQQDVNNNYITYFSNENLINVSVGNTWVRETMLNIGKDDFNVVKGLFLRVQPNSNEEDLRAHLLYATGAKTYTDLHLRPVENLDNVDSDSLTDCNFSIEDYKNVTVKPTTVLDLISKSINLTASSDKANIKEEAAMNLWTETLTNTSGGSGVCNHYVDICGSGGKDSRGSINMWGDGYLDNKGHYSIGPSGSILANDPDVSVLKSGQLRANKGLEVTGGANIDNRLKVTTRGAEIKHSIELLGDDSVATPYIDFHYDGDRSDYTSRIIENESGILKIPKNFEVGGLTTLSKTNILSTNSHDDIIIYPYQYTSDTVKTLYDSTEKIMTANISSYKSNFEDKSYTGTSNGRLTTWTCNTSFQTQYINISNGLTSPITGNVSLTIPPIKYQSSFTINKIYSCVTYNTYWDTTAFVYLYDSTNDSRRELYRHKYNNDSDKGTGSIDSILIFSPTSSYKVNYSLKQGHTYYLQYLIKLENIRVTGTGIQSNNLTVSSPQLEILTSDSTSTICKVQGSNDKIKVGIYTNGILVSKSVEQAIGIYSDGKGVGLYIRYNNNGTPADKVILANDLASKL